MNNSEIKIMIKTMRRITELVAVLTVLVAVIALSNIRQTMKIYNLETRIVSLEMAMAVSKPIDDKGL